MEGQIAIIYGYLVKHGGIGRYISETIKRSKEPHKFRILTLENSVELPKPVEVEIVNCTRDLNFMSIKENTDFSKAVRRRLRNFSLSHSHGVYDFIPDLYTPHICLKEYLSSIEKIFGKKVLKERFSLVLPLANVEGRMLQEVDKPLVFPVSIKVGEELKKNYGIEIRQIIPGASRFCGNRIKNERRKSEIKSVGFIGNDLYTKGLIFLKDALGRLSKKGFKLECISAGTTSEVDLYFGKDENFQYTPLGKTEVDETFYQSLDCFVSLSIYEGYSLSTLEAMSLSVPVISSRFNGVFYDAAKKNRILTEINDITNIEEISALLERIFTDTSFTEKVTKQGKELTDSYRWGNVLEAYNAIYANIR
jgi:glycosyltransferase involved in cell wall biosynthesis